MDRPERLERHVDLDKIEIIAATRSIQIRHTISVRDAQGRTVGEPQFHRTVLQPGDDLAVHHAALVRTIGAAPDVDPLLTALVPTVHTPAAVKAHRARQAAVADGVVVTR